MPVGAAKVTKPCKSPVLDVDVNGQDPLTDTEELFNDDDDKLLIKKKAALIVPGPDDQLLTDTEDVDVSDEENPYEEKDNHPTLEEIGILNDEPKRLVVSQTEGYARHPSPLLSENESDVEGIQHRHKRNMKKTLANMTDNIDQDATQNCTDDEDMAYSGEELSDVNEPESQLPDHYLSGDKSVSSHEAVKSLSPIPKQKSGRTKSKSSPNHLGAQMNEEGDGTTDVEEITLPKKKKE